MNIDLWTESDFFQLTRVRFLLLVVLFLSLLVLEFTVVENLTDRRLRIGGDLYKVKTHIGCSSECVLERNDAQLFTILIDKPDIRYPDLLVDSILLLSRLIISSESKRARRCFLALVGPDSDGHLSIRQSLTQEGQ